MMSRRFQAIFSLGWFIAVTCLGPLARAQGSGAAAAESLFLEGRELMQGTRYAEACKKFEDSQRLDPAVGTALNWARCLARLGRTASAWSRFREAAALAHGAEQWKREETALQEAKLLEPELPRVALRRQRPTLDGKVLLDGLEVPESLFEDAAPVDPGTHEVTLVRGGRVLWRGLVTAIPAQTAELAIPYFEQAAPRQAPSEGPASPRTLAASQSQPIGGKPAGPWANRRTATWVLAALSLGATAFAGFAVVRAKQAYDSSRDGCDGSGKCNAKGLAARELAFDRARQADIALAFAGGAAIGATVLWFSPASNDAPATTSNSRVAFGLSLRGEL